MKTQIISIIIILLISSPGVLPAQKTIVVTADNMIMSAGKIPVYIFSIPEANLEIVKNDWVKMIGQDSKSEIIKTGSEVNVYGAKIYEIYQEPINVLCLILQEDSSVRLHVAFEFNDTFFDPGITAKSAEDEKTDVSIKEFLRRFAIDEYKVTVQSQIDNEVKNLYRYNKELQDLTELVETFRKEIKANEEDIKKSQDIVASLQMEGELKDHEIISKRESVASIKDDPDLKKVANEQLKDLEKEKITIEKKIEKEQNKIKKFVTNIDEMNGSIDNNLQLIEYKKSQIAKQENIVVLVTSKLNEIK